MKAFLIDPKEKTVSEVEYDGNWKSIAPLIHAESGLFDLVRLQGRISEGRADLFVDDEGLCYADGNPHGYFQVNHGGNQWQTLAGYALVLDHDEEDRSVAASCSLEWITSRVRFAP